MDSEPASLDFAVIGHVASWRRALDMVNEFRSPELPRLSELDVREMYSWIPPRSVAQIRVKLHVADTVLRGQYIETFIPPDQLAREHLRSNLDRVRQASAVAIRNGVKIVGLGGFSSIVCEGKSQMLPASDSTAFTTGNTLTAAFIVKGVEHALQRLGRMLSDSSVLIVGSTGDIGSGCVDYLRPKVGRLLLSARASERLAEQQRRLEKQHVACKVVDNLREGLALADVVICVASMAAPTVLLSECSQDALVCDAGYPRNVLVDCSDGSQHLFFGGMGQVRGDLQVQPDIRCALGSSVLSDVSPGCLMEPAILASEGRFEPFSQGRGNITADKMEEIWSLANKHGFVLAPFFNDTGTWGEE